MAQTELRRGGHALRRGAAELRVPAPTTTPALAIDASRRLEHIISWRDAATPTVKARPKGAAGLELYIKVGTAPTSIADCRALARAITRPPNLEEFTATDGGKIAYYIGRWVSTTGEPGPTSEIASATIAAQT